MLSEENKAERLSLITGSDASIICEENPWCTPHKLWEYKTRRAFQEDISEKPAVKAGTMLEGALIDWLGKELGLDIIKSSGLLVKHKDHPWMAGNIDGMVRDGKAIVEIKTTGNEEGWAESGSCSAYAIPRRHLLQIAHYMAVADCERCFVGVLIRGVDFRHYVIERDLGLEAELIAKEKVFYDCMVKDKWPNDDPGILSNENIESAIEFYRKTEEKIEAYQALLKNTRDVICEYMGRATKLFDANGRLAVTYEHRKGRETFDAKEFRKSFPDIYGKFVKVGNPSRAFEVKDLK